MGWPLVSNSSTNSDKSAAIIGKTVWRKPLILDDITRGHGEGKLLNPHVQALEVVIDCLGFARKRGVVIQNQDSSSDDTWEQVFQDGHGRLINVRVQIEDGDLQFGFV